MRVIHSWFTKLYLNQGSGAKCTLMSPLYYFILSDARQEIWYAHEHAYIQLFQLRLSLSKAGKSNTSGKVEYERERLLGIANK
jgi:hypothetical protein